MWSPKGENLAFQDQLSFTYYFKSLYMPDYEWNKMALSRLDFQVIDLHLS